MVNSDILLREGGGICRKATGVPCTGFVEFPKQDLEWKGDRPAVFMSSSGVSRRFCGKCGSSPTFEAEGIVFVTLGSLDHPEETGINCNTYVR